MSVESMDNRNTTLLPTIFADAGGHCAAPGGVSLTDTGHDTDPAAPIALLRHTTGGTSTLAGMSVESMDDHDTAFLPTIYADAGGHCTAPGGDHELSPFFSTDPTAPIALLRHTTGGTSTLADMSVESMDELDLDTALLPTIFADAGGHCAAPGGVSLTDTGYELSPFFSTSQATPIALLGHTMTVESMDDPDSALLQTIFAGEISCDQPADGHCVAAGENTEDAGVQLVHTLMACAGAVQQGDLAAASGLVSDIFVLAASQAGAVRKVATYFAEALARRINSIYPSSSDAIDLDALEMHFNETCAYLKIAHFTANQAILEAIAGEPRVHVVDLGIKQGKQWPALLQGLALRLGGSPAVRLTGVGRSAEELQIVGWKLTQMAERVNVKFEFRGVVATSLADLEPSMLDVQPEEEAVAVSSVMELHKLLAQPGAVEKTMAVMKAARPRIVVVVEQEAAHNGAEFLERFTEALYYYSTFFDSLEGESRATTMAVAMSSHDREMTEAYLGKQICNIVACEGEERVERHECLSQWRRRMEQAGFLLAQLGSSAFEQASMLVALFSAGIGYKVEDQNGCLTLGWQSRPLIATSAWRVPFSTSPAPAHR